VADSAAPALQELRTAAGETRTVTLPDSSRVTLAPGTVLRAPAVFAAADRQVQLEGEAFFDVRADSLRPFIVLTRNARTRVLGTSFLVSEFETDRAAELVVVTGRVEFGSRRMGQPTVITPGQAARVSEDGALVVRSDVDTAERTAWLQGRLVFRDVSFADAIPALERWYGVDIEVSDSTLARARLTAFFERQSLNEVLDLLAETLGARYERTGNRITYAPK
jgi:ferric-dicitrate binding protein FerR (iron transport regulator)